MARLRSKSHGDIHRFSKSPCPHRGLQPTLPEPVTHHCDSTILCSSHMLSQGLCPCCSLCLVPLSGALPLLFPLPGTSPRKPCGLLPHLLGLSLTITPPSVHVLLSCSNSIHSNILCWTEFRTPGAPAPWPAHLLPVNTHQVRICLCEGIVQMELKSQILSWL